MSLVRRRPTASLLAEAVKIIGRKRFEIRQQVSCPREDRQLHYLVETWFFFPQSLQINRWSYTPSHFQQSLKSYIRLGVPVRTLESLLGEALPDELRGEAEAGDVAPDLLGSAATGSTSCCATIRRKPVSGMRTASNFSASPSV
ncbi:MAG: hypothetical protein V8Q84_00500 [Bilophila sp.]